VSAFARLHPRLQEAIVARLGWTSLRPVQQEATEALLDGHNAVVLAPTAGGKTEASFFPTLSQLLHDEPEGLGVLYIAPLKALLNNQAHRLAVLTRMVGLERFVWHGDTPTSARNRFLREPATVLMTTPESLEVMLVSPRVNDRTLFGDLRTVIVDEVHALAGTDRGAHFLSVLERLADRSRHDVQRVGLSATVGNPEAILGWLSGSSERPRVVVNPPAPPAGRELLVVHRDEPELLARDAARMARGGKSLFFCQSRATTESVAEAIRRAGVMVHVHHSSVSLEERQLAEEQFHAGSQACIVCTSTLELGIDVGDLDRVLQHQAPDTVGSFLQRMGRTGRRPGTVANTTFFCDGSEAVLQAAALIELARERWVEDVPVLDRCWPVVVHQLLAMALAEGGIEASEAWRHVSRVPDFSGISQPEFERLLQHLLETGGLVDVSGRLALGPVAEQRFGRRNFMSLYAVFESPAAYKVVGAGDRPIGSLSQSFVDRLVERASTFLLGGRAWRVLRLDHSDREVRVEAAPRGRRPTWGGWVPQFLSLELCQAMRRVLASDQVPPYLHESAARVLGDVRQEFEGIANQERGVLAEGEGEWRWWTFAGGRINSTLKAALLAVGGDWTVVADNFGVAVRQADGRAEVSEAIARLRVGEVWADEALWREVRDGLPQYRLSKFQDLLPEWAQREVVGGFLLDVEGAERLLESGG